MLTVMAGEDRPLQQFRAEVARRRAAPLRLSDGDRDACAEALGEQYALGRLDSAELGRRLDLLHSAVTHGELVPVFEGLPRLSLYAPTARRRGRWRWAVFALAAWMALPFLVLGLIFLGVGREVTAMVFGLPACAWTLVAWRWAARGTRRT
ncbi:MAG: DUF1707 SHOCT-like domain-containing protein [Nocardioidaceae bacterium]